MNKTALEFKKWFDEGKNQIGYFVEGAIIEFTESVAVRMSELDVSKAELATRIDCAPSYVTKVLRGSTNFTLQSMVKIALALESELHISLKKERVAIDWVKVFNKQSQANTSKQIPFEWASNRENIVQYKTNIINLPSNTNDELTVAA